MDGTLADYFAAWNETDADERLLRRENQTLRMEREMLEKAAAVFARETGEP